VSRRFESCHPHLPLMIRKTLLVMSAVLLLVFSGAASELEVTPSNFHEDIVAGDNISKDLRVEWTGDSDTVVYMDATYSTVNVTGTEGFTENFSVNNFELDRGQARLVEVNISSSTALKPAKYFIEITARASQEVEEDVRYVYNDSSNVSDNSTQELQEQLNETEKQLNQSREELEELREVKQELKDNGVDKGNVTEHINQLEDNVTELRLLRNGLQSDLQEEQRQNQQLDQRVDRLEDANALFLYSTVISLLTLVMAAVWYVRGTEESTIDLPNPRSDEE
jgi:hypothetical protein